MRLNSLPPPPPKKEFISNLFVASKKGGDHRPVINLKSLNNFLLDHNFKMGNLHLVKDLLQQNDYMSELDLKDAFHFTEAPGGLYVFNDKVASTNSYFFVLG